MKLINISLGLVLTMTILSCNENRKLPILGERVAEEKVVDGKTIVDTIYQSIPPFSFLNQDGVNITNASLKGNIYVADFFFITCPTICPIMKREMLRVYEKYKGNPNIILISHTIDPEHDTLALLKDFCTRMGSDGKQWMFLTGEKEKIYEIAEKGYYSTALADSTEPGGFIHSGGFILVDKQQHVRGIYDGTETEEVDQLMKDMDILLKEE
ncbi:MAG: SCO family protein [Bacteroidota bacterium]|nr:SCO family protein [Bacteroidota bacterium]